MAKKKNNLMDMAKDSMGLGIGSMAGMGAMGAMAGLPGMPAGTGVITGATGAGLGLLNIGQTAKIGLALPGMMSAGLNAGKKSKKKKYKKDVYSVNCEIPKFRW